MKSECWFKVEDKSLDNVQIEKEVESYSFCFDVSLENIKKINVTSNGYEQNALHVFVTWD